MLPIPPSTSIPFETPADNNSRVVRKRNRVPVSCAPCRDAKLRCNRQSPCDQCLKRGYTSSCAYAAREARLFVNQTTNATSLRPSQGRESLVDIPLRHDGTRAKSAKGVRRSHGLPLQQVSLSQQSSGREDDPILEDDLADPVLYTPLDPKARARTLDILVTAQRQRNTKAKAAVGRKRLFQTKRNTTRAVKGDQHFEIDRRGQLIAAVGHRFPKHFQSAEMTAYARSPSPLTILQKGNSDPFRSLAIDIDAMSNSLIAFGHDILLPLRVPPEPRSTEPDAFLRSCQQEGLAALHDECYGWAWLSIVASVYISLTSEPSQAHLGRPVLYRQRAYENLRTRLRNPDCWRDPKTLNIIEAIISAEMSDLNFVDAGVHSRALDQLFERYGVERLDQWVLEAALLNENIRCIVTWTPSFYTFPNWKMTPIHYPVNESSPEQYPVTPSGFKDTLLDPALLNIVTNLQEILVTDLHITRREKPVPDIVFRSLNIRQRICHGRLFNYYLDISSKPPIPRTEDTTALNMAVCLAVLLWSSRRYHVNMGNSLNFMLHNLHHALSAQLPRIRRSNCDPGLRLWILYVGAMIEHTVPSAEDAKREMELLFTAQAHWMRLASWVSVETELERFLYADGMLPAAFHSEPLATTWEYPAHPFSGALCLQIARLPAGLRDLTIDLHLSTAVIDALARFSTAWVERHAHDDDSDDDNHDGTRAAEVGLIADEELEALHRLASAAGISDLEKLLCWTLVALAETRTPTADNDDDHHVQELCAQGPWMAETAGDLISDSDAKPVTTVVAWMVLVLASVSQGALFADAPRRGLMLQVKRCVMLHGPRVNWDTHGKGLVRKFFWTEDLLRRWEVAWLEIEQA